MKTLLRPNGGSPVTPHTMTRRRRRFMVRLLAGATTYQTVAGFGASEAFGEADTVMNASSAIQQQALDLLYSPTSGAGLTILRNEISADAGITIEPTAPASPTATPAYSALGNDQGPPRLVAGQRVDPGLHLPRRPEDHERLERGGQPER
jgi:hypothetical protein